MFESCTNCGRTIFLGGQRVAGNRYCGAKCRNEHAALDAIPDSDVEALGQRIFKEPTEEQLRLVRARFDELAAQYRLADRYSQPHPDPTWSSAHVSLPKLEVSAPSGRWKLPQSTPSSNDVTLASSAPPESHTRATRTKLGTGGEESPEIRSGASADG